MNRRLSTALTGFALLATTAGGGLALAPIAHAIPEDGAGANTPGTSSQVAPTSLTAGSTLSFSVGGFPAGEVVNIKIDDGLFCSESGTHGACVVHMQRIGSDGRASGSFTLPTDLAPGSHWLRFLASKVVTGGGGGTLGYTRRSPNFTIVSGGSTTVTTPAPGGSSQAPSQPGATASAPADGATAPTASATGEAVAVASAGARIPLTAGPNQPTPEPTPTPSASPSAEPTATEAVAPASSSTEDREVPWLGIGGGAALLAGAAGLLLFPRRRAQG